MKSVANKIYQVMRTMPERQGEGAIFVSDGVDSEGDFEYKPLLSVPIRNGRRLLVPELDYIAKERDLGLEIVWKARKTDLVVYLEF